MAKNYYNAGSVLNIIYEWTKTLCSDAVEAMARELREKIINELPTIGVQEIGYGRWIEDFDDIKCSACGATFNICENDTQKFQYCPCCGALMDGDEWTDDEPLCIAEALEQAEEAKP